MNDQIMKSVTSFSWIIISLIIYALLKRNKPSPNEKGISKKEIKARGKQQLLIILGSATLGYVINLIVWLILEIQNS